MLPRKNRVSKALFAQLRNPRRASGTLCSISIFPLAKNEHTKIACVVGAAVSKSAVERNRVKRRFRDILRTYVAGTQNIRPVAIIVYVKKEARQAKYSIIKKEVATLVKNTLG